jgi:hypothetical protein
MGYGHKCLFPFKWEQTKIYIRINIRYVQIIIYKQMCNGVICLLHLLVEQNLV